jgi:glyoxylase I family protein
VLGFTIDEHRPDLGYPGAWLNIGATQIHLIRLPNPDPVADRPSRVGHDRHVALKTRDIDEVQSALQAAGVSYGRSSSGRRALFCRDPDGNGLEFVDHTHD